MPLTSKLTTKMRSSDHSRKRLYMSQETLRQLRKKERQNKKINRH